MLSQIHFHEVKEFLDSFLVFGPQLLHLFVATIFLFLGKANSQASGIALFF